MYLRAASVIDLVFQFLIFWFLIRSVGYILNDKLKEHGRRSTLITILMIGSVGVLMIPRFLLIWGKIYETILIKKDLSNSFLNTHLSHAFFGLLTIISTVYTVLDWVRVGFDDEAHEGGKMWASTISWVLALFFGIGVFIVDLYVFY
jgi:hypothetical protein